MKITPGNAQDIGARKERQNLFCFSDSVNARFVAHAGRLAVVADGTGGPANGGSTSTLAVRSFLREYESKRAPESIPAALQFSLAAAFRAVGSLHQSAEADSSLMAAVVCQDLLYWISVGHSHIYLLRDGELAQLNRAHNCRQKMLDDFAQSSFSLSQASSHPGHKHLTSDLGMADPSEVDCNVRPLALRISDRVILCSDSVYRLIGATGIAQVFQEPTSAASESIRHKVSLSATRISTT
jgi:protein phosphatase